MKRFFFLLLFSLLSFPAYAQKTKAQLNTEIGTNFPDNTTGAITPSLLRSTTTDFVASWVDYLLCGASGGIVYWDASVPPAPTCLPKGTNGQFLTLTAGLPAWATFASSWPSGGGPATGTSGGIPYFNSATTTLSSGALTANLPVIGGGAGAAPTVGTRTGNTTAFVTSTGALTSTHCVQIDVNGNFVDAGIVCGGTSASTIIPPQGRLTVQSGTPVMTTDQINQGTLFYSCYKGGNQVPYNTGGADLLDTIAACQVSTAMVSAASAGQVVAGQVYDAWWVHGGANRICLAMSAATGGGVGWPSVTARSGIAALDTTTKPYITNVNVLTNCFNAATNYGPVAANQGTYLGTIYATANGQTGMAFRPTSANGGTANVLGVYNAYNQVPMDAYNFDNGGNVAWTVSSTTFALAHASAGNTITYVDGLGTSAVSCEYAGMTNPGTGSQLLTGCEINWSSGAPRTIQTAPFNVAGSFHATQTLPPTLGLNVVSAIEAMYAANGSGHSINVYPTCTAWLCSVNTGQMEMLAVRLGAM